jgi:tRNA 2-thiouridine synthesizing protein A
MNDSSPPDESPVYSASGDYAIAEEVDARGLACPLPLLKAKLALNRMVAGQCLRVLATDGGSVRDFHAYAELSGHKLLHFHQSDNEYEYVLQKA